MNVEAFITALHTRQNSIAITSPMTMQVRRSYWGAPADAITDLPCFINALSEPERTLGMGRRREARYRVNVQLLVAKTMPEDARSGRIATNFWLAAKNAFDADTTIGGTVTHAILQGATPTVPVALMHGGQSYIGFDAFLDVHHVEVF